MNPAPHCGMPPCDGMPLEENVCNQDIPCYEGFFEQGIRSKKCKRQHEIYFAQKVCEKTCHNRFNANLMQFCTEQSKCICADGFYRNEKKLCVPAHVCDACVVKGQIYQQGQIWNALDGCEVCQCVAGLPICKKMCEIPECSANEKLVYQEHNKCCPKCQPITETTCGLHKTWDYLLDESGQCQSDDKLHLTYCSGGCGDGLDYPVLTDSPAVESVINCRTCVGNVARIKEAIVTCLDKKQKTMYYPEFWCCKCTECRV